MFDLYVTLNSMPYADLREATAQYEHNVHNTYLLLRYSQPPLSHEGSDQAFSLDIRNMTCGVR